MNQPDTAEPETIKLLKDVVRIRDVTWDERVRMANFVKIDTPVILKQVNDLHNKRMDILKGEGKTAAREEYTEVRAIETRFCSSGTVTREVTFSSGGGIRGKGEVGP